MKRVAHPPLALASRRRRQGFALAFVLWFVVLLTVLAVSLAYRMHVGMKMASYGAKRVQAEGLARAGVAKAVVDLKNDRLMAIADPAYASDTPMDIWARADDKTDVSMGKGTYTVRVIDDNSKLDLNAITPSNRQALEYLLMTVCETSDAQAKELTDAYLDYVDADDKAIADPDQTEASYYQKWMEKNQSPQLDPDRPYRPKNDALLDEAELLNVPGFTKEMLYGDPAKTPRDPIERADWPKQSTALLDYVTADVGGRVNLNTAKMPTLEAMLYAAADGKADNVGDLAKSIDDYRVDQMKMSKSKSRGILDPAELRAAGISPIIREKLGTLFTLSTSSTCFDILSRGTVQGVRSTMAMRVSVSVQRYAMDLDKENGQGLRDPRAFGFLKSQESFKIDPEVRVARVYQP
jgi:type II secretory pathway component PulK